MTTNEVHFNILTMSHLANQTSTLFATNDRESREALTMRDLAIEILALPAYLQAETVNFYVKKEGEE